MSLSKWLKSTTSLTHANSWLSLWNMVLSWASLSWMVLWPTSYASGHLEVILISVSHTHHFQFQSGVQVAQVSSENPAWSGEVRPHPLLQLHLYHLPLHSAPPSHSCHLFYPINCALSLTPGPLHKLLALFGTIPHPMFTSPHIPC